MRGRPCLMCHSSSYPHFLGVYPCYESEPTTRSLSTASLNPSVTVVHLLFAPSLFQYGTCFPLLPALILLAPCFYAQPTILCFAWSSTTADATVPRSQSSNAKSASSMRNPLGTEKKRYRLTGHALHVIVLAGDRKRTKTTGTTTTHFWHCSIGSIGSWRLLW